MTKTPGQIAYEACYSDATNITPWEVYAFRDNWEKVAAAVLAHATPTEGTRGLLPVVFAGGMWVMPDDRPGVTYLPLPDGVGARILADPRKEN